MSPHHSLISSEEVTFIALLWPNLWHTAPTPRNSSLSTHVSDGGTLRTTLYGLALFLPISILLPLASREARGILHLAWRLVRGLESGCASSPRRINVLICRKVECRRGRDLFLQQGTAPWRVGVLRTFCFRRSVYFDIPCPSSPGLTVGQSELSDFTADDLLYLGLEVAVEVPAGDLNVGIGAARIAHNITGILDPPNEGSPTFITIKGTRVRWACQMPRVMMDCMGSTSEHVFTSCGLLAVTCLTIASLFSVVVTRVLFRE